VRKPVVDYRQFRLSKWNDPTFSHVKLLLGWVGYFVMYILTENLIPAERCTPVHCALDDKIPFCEIFLIPYVGWYLFVIGSLLYFFLYHVENFKRLQIFIIVTQVVAMAIYVIFPNRQDLRPLDLPRDNFLTQGVAFLYSFDTNTGVCPSLHCAYSIGITSIFLKEKQVGWWVKTGVIVFTVLVCLSTMFIKQHSFLDFLAALPVCLLAEIIACGGYWKTYRTKRQSAAG